MRHPQIAQGKQHREACHVLGQSPVTHLGVAKLLLDHPKRVLHLGAHTGFELLSRFDQVAPGRVLVLPALARPHGNLPDHTRGFLALACTLVTRIGEDDLFFTVQQGMDVNNSKSIRRLS